EHRGLKQAVHRSPHVPILLAIHHLMAHQPRIECLVSLIPLFFGEVIHDPQIEALRFHGASRVSAPQPADPLYPVHTRSAMTRRALGWWPERPGAGPHRA